MILAFIKSFTKNECARMVLAKIGFIHMTLDDLHFMKNLCLHNISNHRKFYQNQLIYECAGKKKASSPGIPEFLVRYRRTYVLNKLG